MNMDFTTIPVIVLAAGKSKRMGTLKGLLEFQGKPFLSHQIQCLQKIGFSNIFTVLSKYSEIYLKAIPELKKIQTIMNPKPENGPFSSIQCGLKEIQNTRKGAFILPVDVPCPNREVWETLAKSMEKNEISSAIPEYKGKKGHPVLLSDDFIKKLRTSNKESRLDYEIRKQQSISSNVEDEKITLNLNTPEEWRKFKEKELK